MRISGDFRDTREWRLSASAFVVGILALGLAFGSDLPGPWRALIGTSGVVLVGLMLALAFLRRKSPHRAETGRARRSRR